MMGRDLSGVKVTVFMLRITDNLIDEIVDNLLEPDASGAAYALILGDDEMAKARPPSSTCVRPT